MTSMLDTIYAMLIDNKSFHLREKYNRMSLLNG